MCYDYAGLFGYILSIILDPVVWAAIVLWILYAKRKTRSLKIWAIVCSSIAGLFHFVLQPLTGIGI